jgi:hypothetical protein
MGLRVVGADRDDGDAAIGVLAGDRVDAVLPREHVRAVIAELDQDEHVGPRVVRQRVPAIVDAGKVELGDCLQRDAGHVSASLI